MALRTKRPSLVSGKGLLWALALLLALPGPPALAQVTIMTTGAYHNEIERIVMTSGIVAVITTDTAGGGLRRVRAGEHYDLVVNTPTGITALINEGKLSPPQSDVARIGIGVAVRTGTPMPDLSSEEAFRSFLLAVPSIAMVDPAAGGSSGIYLVQLFERWGILEVIKPKLVLVQGGRAATRVASGEAAVALQQLTELNVSGVAVAGPLPAAIQSYTVYSAALSTTGPAETRVLLDAMTLKTDQILSVPKPKP